MVKNIALTNYIKSVVGYWRKEGSKWGRVLSIDRLKNLLFR
jgi:hypothetical protein